MIVIEALGPDRRESGRYAGQPQRALVEHDGLRWLLADFPVPEGVWRHAVQFRAVGILHGDGSIFADEVNLLPRRDGLILAPGHAPVVARASRPFVHLHAHSEYSPLDGLATIDEMVNEVIADGQDAIAVTDHGVCAGHLELQRIAQSKGVKPIFGIEAYLVDEARDKDPSKRNDYWHFILLAQNEVGLRNLWRASTMAHSPEQFYYRPRMDWRTLSECSEGIIASTACLRGPLSHLIEDGDEQGAIEMLGRMQAIFGDRLYLELHLNQLDRQLVVNKGLVELAHSRGLPLIAVGDSHYACASDRDAHQVWIAAQTDKTLQDEGDLFAGHQDYHIHSSDEALSAIEYLGRDIAEEAIANTAEVARMCDATIKPRRSTPVYHRHLLSHSENQGAEKDYEVLVRLCREAWSERIPHDLDDEMSAVYQDRLDEELNELRTKGFCGYLLVVWEYIRDCRDNGILVGPGRGSAAGSLVCYLLGITQIDPIEADLLFERFISPGRTSLPDIDSDFPQSKRGWITDRIVQRWGEDHVVRVGTVTRLRNKGVFREVARVLKGSEHEVPYLDLEAILKIVEEAESHTAGLGMSWDALMASVGEGLAPYAERHPMLFHYAGKLVGRLKTYGKHPAGLVIDPAESVVDWLPLRQGDEDYPVTEFPMDQLDLLGLVKFDILTVRTLDTIQETMDLIEADPRYAGRIPHPHTWRDEYQDPMVWDMICAGDTLGIFQIETSSGTRLTKRFQPRSLADLCAILTLVRPGPMNSGLTDSYIRRRAGDEPVVFDHPLLEQVLHKTYGTMIYQEDIMNVTKVIAGYSSAEADDVRSILGKKKVEKIAAEGQRFVVRAVERGIDEALATRMFSQMEEFAKYSFNKSHSWSYAVLAFWCAWFKAHFPAHFLVACLSTADKDRFPEYVTEARRRGYRVDLPDVNESGMTFTVSQDGLGVRYGLSSVKGLGDKAAAAILEGRPYTSWDDFVERRGPKCNWGHVKLLAEIGALDSLIPEGHSRVDLIDVCDQMATGKLEQCVHLRPDRHPSMGVEACCGFDWLSEPPVIGKSGKPLKPKPIPKACTKACRRYEASSAIVWRTHPPMRPRDIRAVEREAFGVYISSTPFDHLALPPEGLASHADVSAGPEGSYMVVAEIAAVRSRTDRLGRKMAFLTLMLPDGFLDAVVFSKEWDTYAPFLQPISLALFSVTKTARGLHLHTLIPLIQE